MNNATETVMIHGIEHKFGAHNKVFFMPAGDWIRCEKPAYQVREAMDDHREKLQAVLDAQAEQERQLKDLPHVTQEALSKAKPDGPRLGKNGKMKILLALMDCDHGLTKKEIGSATKLSDSAVHSLIRKLKPNIVKAGRSRKCTVGERQTVTWELVA